MINAFTNYQQFVRPELAEVLKALNLDVVYHKAKGNKMYYRNHEGNEVEVSDYLSGYGAGLFGHNHPDLTEVLINALQEDAVFLGQASIRPGAAELACSLSERIKKFTKKDYISVFGNSGAEAVEAALKHSAIHYRQRANTFLSKIGAIGNLILASQDLIIDKLPDEILKNLGEGENEIFKINATIEKLNSEILIKPPLFLALKNAFHGKTNGSLNLTYNHAFRISTDDLPLFTNFIEDVEDLKKVIADNTHQVYGFKIKDNKVFVEKIPFVAIAALFIEPIQGEGGINVLSQNSSKQFQEICKINQIIIIADEIQCGMGRTGTFLYSEQIGLDADCYLLSKSLGGGISKISAAVFAKSHFIPNFSVIHSSTFSEDELSSRVALKSVSFLSEENEVLPLVRRRGNLIKEKLMLLWREFSEVIEEVKGEGLMLGIVFKERTLSKSNTIKFLEKYNFLGYAISGFLLQEFRIRIAPALSQGRTIRVEPSYLVSMEEITTFIASLKVICNILERDNISQLLAHLLGKSFRDYEEKNFYYDFNPIIEETDSSLKKVAFIGHFIKPSDITLWDPGLSVFNDEELGKLIHRINPIAAPLIYNKITVSSISGVSAQCMFIGLPVASSQIYNGMINHNNSAVKKMVESAVNLAVSEGCSVVGLGGYTSIVTRNGKDLAGKGVAITTGNAFTVSSAIEAIQTVAHENDIHLHEKIAAVIGASGNIGSIVAEILSDMVQQIWLISRPNKKESLIPLAGKCLRNLIKADKIKSPKFYDPILSLSDVQLYHFCEEVFQGNSPVVVSDTLGAVHCADVLVSASNQPGSILFPQMIKNDSVIICDISVPSDADDSIKACFPNIKIVKGGIISAPLNNDFYIPGIPLQKGELYACMTETILMGLEGMNSNFSFGQIHKEQVVSISKIAKKHGFTVSRIKSEVSY